MYEEYYGFAQPPFSLSPDPRFLYRSESHDVALEQVWQAVRRKEGFIVLTGDIGTGKTTISRTLLGQFDQTTFSALILNPFLTVEELLHEVLLSFGVVSKDALRTSRLATASKHELIRTLHEFLLSLLPVRGSAVLIIDEAQHLSTDVLEEIRILSNLETNDQKLLQIVIVGQLNLLDMLRKAELRQLDQRISIRCSLKPLTRDEVEAYVTHRLWVARGTTPVTFTPKAFDLVHTVTGGVPRIINLVCDRALMIAAKAQTATITEEHVNGAAEQIKPDLPRQQPRVERASPRPRPAEIPVTIGAPAPRASSPLRTVAIAAALVLIAAAGLVFVFLGNPLELLNAGVNPGVRSSPRPWQPAAARAVAVPAGVPREAPPVEPGTFSIAIGTYDNIRLVDLVEAGLADRKIEFYVVDIQMAPGDVQRRVLVGRYASREEAEKARNELGPAMNTARVIPAEWERLRQFP